MIKRILVALDPDADTPVATETAIRIATRCGATLTGIALIDREAIDEDTAGGGIGSMYFAEKMRERITAETRVKAQALVQAFGEQVDAAGVEHTGDRVGEDGLVASLVDEMRTHDLLIAGRESHFYYKDPERRTHTMAKVVETGAAATLLVGAEEPHVRRVLVAYDGSTASSRTLQKFAHLSPFGLTIEVEIVHVRDGSADARLASDYLTGAARDYLVAHGYTTVHTTGLEGSKPADAILEHAATTHADLIVSGAYAKTGVKRWLLGSSATTLLEKATLPLFLYR